MSGDGFHVHGPHDHELEHAAHADPQGMAGRLAVATAIIATVAALFSYMGGLKQTNASLFKNESAIKKTEAANQWAFYQAKNNRQNLAEFAVDVVPEARRSRYQDEAKRYEGEKAKIREGAERLELESKTWGERSESEIHEHHRWAQATTALQISIALAAIALLTKSRWLQKAVYGVSAIGVLIGILAAMHR
jgi:hypothetical protein